MATIDPNGVLIYQDTDNYTPIQTALNLAQSNLSSILGANTQVVRVSSVGDRNAKATARGSISKANPFVVWRADAADGLQLEYTTNGTTWRTIADKEYYDSQDTDWLPIAPRVNVVNQAAQVRRIGSVLHFRGTLINGASSPEAAWPTGVHALGDLPAAVTGSWSTSASARTITGNTSTGIPVALQAWIAGRTVTIYQPGGGTASQAVLAGLSGLAV